MTYPLKPLSEPFPPEVAEVLSQYPRQNGYLLTLFRTFANSVRFLMKGVPNLLDAESPLSLRIREITILRVTANLRCEYEWGVHVAAFSKAAKLTAEQVEATVAEEIDPGLWTREEASLLETIDQFCEAGTLHDAVLERFQSDWTQEQQLEIIALCGTYHTVSFVANTARLPAEPFGAKFPT